MLTKKWIVQTADYLEVFCLLVVYWVVMVMVSVSVCVFETSVEKFMQWSALILRKMITI